MENIPVAAAAVGRGGRTPGEPPQSLASPSAMSTEVTEVRDSCSSIPDWAGAWAEGFGVSHTVSKERHNWQLL